MEEKHCSQCGARLVTEHAICPSCFFDDFDEDPSDDLSEQVVGPYRLIEKIGTGGFGEVYRAEQVEHIVREVALKVIKVGMDSGSIIRRFQAERQTLALMNHPYIASVYEVGTTDLGQPYFAMELVDGLPLTDYCDTHAIGIEERLELFCEVCQAIQHAHGKGVVHRDLKPSNILVTAVDGKPVPKIIDFGIAKAMQHQDLMEYTLTHQDQFLGTLLYSAPEQISSETKQVHFPSDTYSLGVVLYELLTGKLPFDPTSISIDRITNDDPPIASKRVSTLGNDEQEKLGTFRGVDEPKWFKRFQGDLDRIVSKSIRKNPDNRYESCADLRRDLIQYLTDHRQIQDAQTSRKRLVAAAPGRRKAISGLLLIAALVSTVITGAILGRKENPLTTNRSGPESPETHFLEAKENLPDNPGANRTPQETRDSDNPSIDAIMAGHQLRLREALDKIGQAAQTVDFVKTRQLYDEAEALFEEVGQSPVKCPDTQIEYHHYLVFNKGAKLDENGNLEDALEVFEKSKDVISQISPHEDQYIAFRKQWGIGVSLERIWDVNDASGIQQNLDSFENDARKRHEMDPLNIWLKFAYAAALDRVADVEFSKGKKSSKKKARTKFEEALKLRIQIETHNWAADLGKFVSHLKLGEVASTHDFVLAEEHYGIALKIVNDNLDRLGPERYEIEPNYEFDVWQEYLARHAEKMGRLFEAIQEDERAMEYYENALQLFETLAESGPVHSLHNEHAANVEINLGRIYSGQKKYKEAAEIFNQARNRVIHSARTQAKELQQIALSNLSWIHILIQAADEENHLTPTLHPNGDNHFAAAVNLGERARKLDIGNLNGSKYLPTNLGIALLLSGNFSRAVLILEEGFDHDPSLKNTLKNNLQELEEMNLLDRVEPRIREDIERVTQDFEISIAD